MRKITTLIISIFLISFQILTAQVDINRASVKELTENVHELNTDIAEKIVKFRRLYGPFMSVDDLTKVEGINDDYLEKIRDDIIAVQPLNSGGSGELFFDITYKLIESLFRFPK